MKLFKGINWNENGWTTIQEANEKLHILEITCYAENGVVTEIRKRHNDGEEEKITKAIDAENSLPMDLSALKELVKNNSIKW